MSEDQTNLSQLRSEIEEVERRTVRTVDLGRRGMTLAISVFVLIIGYVLPWMSGANGLDVLFGHHDAVGKASMVPRLFAGTSLGFGILCSAAALITRRWALAWAAALGGWFASVDGVLAIWSRQSSAGAGASGPGIGLIIAEVAMIAIAIQWFRTAWSRS